MLILLCAAALIQGAAQEPAIHLRAITKDGQAVAGTPAISSVQIESSLGAVEIKLKSLQKVVFDGDTAAATGQDGSTLKGKLSLDVLKLSGAWGAVSLERSVLKEFWIQHGSPFAAFGDEADQAVLAVRTKDGNELVGTTDLSKLTIESTLGKFDIDIRLISSFTKAVKPNQLALKDGSEFRGTAQIPDFKLKSGLGEFVIKADALSAFSVREIRRPPAPPQPLPPPRGNSGKPPPASGPPPGPALQPVKKVEVKSALSDVRLSKDGSHLYAVNLSEGKLCRWKLPVLDQDGVLALSGGEKAVALDAAGRRIVAAGQKTVTLIGSEPFAQLKSFQVETAVEDVAVLDGDTILGTGSQGIIVISISKTAVTQTERAGASKIAISPLGDRAFIGESTWDIVKEPGGGIRIDSLGIYNRFGSGADASMIISPDGRHACNSAYSAVHRLGRCWSAAKVMLTQVEQHTASMFSLDSQRLYLFTEAGFLKVYDTREFKIQGSHYLGVRVAQALMAPDSTSLVVAGAPVTDQSGRRPPFHAVNPGAVVDHLYRFEIPK